MNQYVGHIVAEEDKCIAFPNIYQHRVDAFELADPTRPGYRKILCFFVVNPFTRVLSTSDVPPQQAEWGLDEAGRAPLMRGLPAELFEMIARETELMVREEAEEHRHRSPMSQRARPETGGRSTRTDPVRDRVLREGSRDTKHR